MYHKQFGNMDEAYKLLIEDIKVQGDFSLPRGQSCIELRPAAFSIYRAMHGLYKGKDRGLNYRFWAIETLMYIAGWGDAPHHAELLVMSNSNVDAYVNPDTGIFDGAYGPRLVRSLNDCVKLLKKDKDSRQATASIWEPGLLQDFGASKDIPCTLSLSYYMTPNGLSSSAVMRSNDINWGTPYDVGAFCAIQCLIADLLEVIDGPYNHFANSLHIYTKREPQFATSDEKWEVSIPRLRSVRSLPSEFGYVSNAAENYLNFIYGQLKNGVNWPNLIPPNRITCEDYFDQWHDIITGDFKRGH